MSALTGKRILILATHGFEQSELDVPHAALQKAGATVDIVSPEAGEIKGWQNKDWGRSVAVDRTLDQVRAEDYDAIVLPGGQMNPDTLRGNDKALGLIKSFFDQGKVVAAVCHGPWLLIDTGIAKGRKVTSYKTIKQDLINAGASWQDAEVVTDKGIVTSRKPDDLPAFVAKIIEEVQEGRHDRKAA
ncbi:type 1 glutamine amidotransferase domain-containing protein [Bosea robiniae]|uniref:Protease I n=1 Tax=Bosea robiniae TaxID=1036780 RepID=A0ABY0PAQ9_9HYPH|nr:type 1 glutamine amidotransferase domain-containing protein [Bosea robiniae]SDH79214.1 protease I [Bosea robiniae]